MFHRSALMLFSFVAMYVAAATASAQTSWAGAWRAGTTSVQAEVSDWGADCGPRPESTTVSASGDVRITQEGDHLTLFTRPQVNTQSCWSENPAVRKVSASVQVGTWRVICRTPEDDPRGEVGTYTLRALGDNTLEKKDVSRFNWRLNASQCVAVVTATQRFERVSAAAPVVVAPSAPPVIATPRAPEPVLPACSFTTAAKIELRPSPSTVELGERTCVRALLIDAAGCRQVARAVVWELNDGGGGKTSAADGCFTLSAVGTYTLEARSGALRAQLRFVGKVPDYSKLRVAEQGSDAGARLVAVPTRTSGEAAGSATPTASSPNAPTGVLVAAAFALVTAITLLVLLLVLRSRRARVEETKPSEPVATPSSTTAPNVAPPQPEYGDNMDTIIAAPRSDMSLRPPAVAAIDTGLVPTQDRICPTCRRGFGLESTFCPHDGTPLITYAAFKDSVAAELTCPVCTLKYPIGTRFCGKDGAALS